ncbi:hypothetical protein ACFUJ0_27990 [Streptomyces sp. NPDC057242]|uniref:hypothetical protein n=1 Tax=unclassified Streptomyces TaxID=2593676 RepID=UPI00363DB4EF
MRPLLADAADSLGGRLAVLGRHRDAVAPATLLRRLVPTDPAAYRSEPARVLDNPGIRLRDADRHAEALAATGESPEIHRRLHRDDPAAHLPGLVHALADLALRRARLDRHDGVAAPRRRPSATCGTWTGSTRTTTSPRSPGP